MNTQAVGRIVPARMTPFAAGLLTKKVARDYY